MNPADLLTEASRRGIHLEVDGEGLRYKGPRGAMTPELREALTANKGKLRQLLTAPPADFLSEDPCATCGWRDRWQWLDGRDLCRVCFVLDLAPLTLGRKDHHG
jgi:hypothetical protein